MRKKTLTIIVISFICAFFAMSAFASTSFMLAHAVNTPLNYNLSFRDYATQLEAESEEISEYSFDGDGRYLFTSLYLSFNRTLMFESITVSFTDMVNTIDDTAFYPYHMEVLVPGDDTEHLVETTEEAGGHGAGVAKIIASPTAFKRTTTDASEDRRLADFAITLYGGEDFSSGTYKGTVTLSFVAN